jgi:hypothetical protein
VGSLAAFTAGLAAQASEGTVPGVVLGGTVRDISGSHRQKVRAYQHDFTGSPLIFTNTRPNAIATGVPLFNPRRPSLRRETKMPPPQASGKRREFDPLQVNFVCYLKYLIRGGGRSLAKRVSIGGIPC